MGRSDCDDYGDCCDYNLYGLQIGWITRAIKGKKGQAALRELEAALLVLPEKRLITDNFCKNGQVCALGALALKRRIDAGKTVEEAHREIESTYGVDPEFDHALTVARRDLGLSASLAIEVMEKNDASGGEWIKAEGRYEAYTPEERYERVLKWVREQIAGNLPSRR